MGKYNLIEQIAVIADGKKFVSALIVPNYEMLTQAFKDLNIKYKKYGGAHQAQSGNRVYRQAVAEVPK